MSQDIMNEVVFLLHSLVLGAVITFVYDGFLILRRLIKHTMILVSLEDMLFWICCAIFVFFMLYKENNGILRWFAVLGAGIGMLIYKKTLSGFVVGGVTKVLSFLIKMFSNLLHILLKPLFFLNKKRKEGNRYLRRKSGKIRKYIRNKLTAYKKVLKMILCKH